jgi:hypothetical protein
MQAVQLPSFLMGPEHPDTATALYGLASTKERGLGLPTLQLSSIT